MEEECEKILLFLDEHYEKVLEELLWKIFLR